MLKTEQLAVGKPRAFDSYDPFPLAPGTPRFLGDGINAKVLLNDRQLWPATGWQYASNATVRIPFDVRAEVKTGDRLIFLVNMNANIGYDTTAFDPTIAYEDGEKHTASKEFGDGQGRAGWRYQYLENGKYEDLVYYPAPRQWRKKQDNATGTPFVGVGDEHPDVGQDAARVWTAPKAGRVRITGSVCNTGNPGPTGVYGFHMGSSTYAPWNALYDRDSRDGLFLGWDYFGHWASAFRQSADGTVSADLKVAGHRHTLAPGQSVETPKAFVALYHGDLDDAGNEVLDWQYRYLWDYTRDRWFPAIRMLGFWFNGTGWGQSGVGWTGGGPDWPSTFRKVFRVADLMRYVGADVYHRDWGWWDRAGDWNGPDFRATGQYLRKSGMGQLIYAFLYTVDGQSKVAREHPQWLGVPPFLGPPLGNTWYDSLQAKVTKRFSHGLDFQGAFTWQKELTLGANSDTSYLTPSPPIINYVYDRKVQKQISGFALPLMFVVSFNYTMPKIADSNSGMRILSLALRDWRLGGVLRYQSGQLIRTPASNNGIMNQLALALRDSHTIPVDRLVNVDTVPEPGVPLLGVSGWTFDPSGACLTAQDDGSALVYSVMANWGANHSASSFGHIGADLITLASLLRIPVCMHNLSEDRIFRPSSWNAFGMDKEGSDYRACLSYGPVYK